MPRYELMENHPLQMLSFEDLQAIVADVVETLPHEWKTKVANREWRKLVKLVGDALEDAYLLGPVAKETWLPKVAEEFRRIEEKRSPGVRREVRIAYEQLLDRIYGAILRHSLRRVSTVVCGEHGELYLSRLLVARTARLANASHPSIEELIEFIYMGGPRFEVEFSWEPLGDGLADGRPERRRRID